MNCIQCGTATTDNYCPNCGQKQQIPRLTFNSFIKDFIGRIYGFDGAFPNTLTGLTTHPGKTVKEFIKGIRGRYVSPVGYYFLMFGIFLIIANLSESTIIEYYPSSSNIEDSMQEFTGEEIGDRAAKINNLIQRKIFDNLQYFSVLMIPFFGLWSRVFYKKSGYNAIEGMILAFYLFGHAVLFDLIGFIIYNWFSVKSLTLSNVAQVVYFSWGCTQFYNSKTSFTGILKGLFYYLISSLSFMIFAVISISIGVLLKYF